MSTLAYGVLTRQREEAVQGTSKSSAPPGAKPYLDALAALVPAEVLAFHAFALSLTTKTGKNAAGEVVTTITEPTALQVVFGVLIVLSMVFYFVGHRAQQWDGWDWLRMLVPAAAFVGWTMAQKSTAFDAVWPGLPDVWRTLGAGLLAVILGLFAGTLGADKADEKPAPARPAETPAPG